MDDLIVAVAQKRPIHRGSLMGLDHNCPGSNPDPCLHQLKVIICPMPDIRIGMYVHINDAL
jgi:hypothetical protein